MAEKEIRIGFPGAKMEALEFFMGKKNETAEDVLREHLDKTYEKYVPQQVREFVESRMLAEDTEGPVAGNGIDTGESAGRQTRQRGTRRNQRQARVGTPQDTTRMQDAEAAQSAQEQGRQEADTPDEDMEQAGTGGMSMQM